MVPGIDCPRYVHLGALMPRQSDFDSICKLCARKGTEVRETLTSRRRHPLVKQASEPRTASEPRAISDCRTTVSVTQHPEDRKPSVTVSRRHTTMSEHIATCQVLGQWSSLPLAFVSRSVGVVSGTPSSSPALRRTVGRATRGFVECRANSPLGMGVHHELAQ